MRIFEQIRENVEFLLIYWFAGKKARIPPKTPLYAFRPNITLLCGKTDYRPNMAERSVIVAQYRLTMYYRLGKAGWSETFYKEFAQGPDDRSPSESVISSLINCRGPGTILEAYRWTNLDEDRDSELFRLNRTPKVNFAPTQDVVNTAAVCRVTGTSGAIRHMWLRSLKDNQVRTNNDGTDNPGAGLTQAIQTIERALVTNQYQIQRIKPLSINPWRGVDRLVSSGAGGDYIEVQAFDPVILAPGDLVYFRKFDKCKFPGLIGHHKIVQLTATGFIVQVVWPDGLPSPQLTPGMQYRHLDYTYEGISKIRFQFFRSRQTGRPFDLPRGRSSARLSCRT